MTTTTSRLTNFDVKEQEKTLFLLQVANSSFPTGVFNHSYGFETLFSSGTVHDGPSFEVTCRDWLVYCLARSEGIAVARSCQLAKLGDQESLIEIDCRLGVLKLSREAREASSMTGQALLNAYIHIFDKPSLEGYARAVKAGEADGHHAVVFGAICGSFDIWGADAVLTFLQAAVSGLAGVASRLIPLGQVETQRIIKNTWPLIQKASQMALDANLDDMNTATPSLEVASMQHETLNTRLCIS